MLAARIFNALSTMMNPVAYAGMTVRSTSTITLIRRALWSFVAFILLALGTATAFAQDNAVGVTISAPTTMAPGAKATVTVTMQNTGTSTWVPGVANPYRLGSQNPENNVIWGLGRVEIPTNVLPGNWSNFTFTITAPSTPGVYSFNWRMLREGAFWFGNTISATITVATPDPVYDAQLVSASVPTAMTAGNAYNVSMTFKNTGNTTWTPPDFILGNSDDKLTFGFARVSLSGAVAPGQSAAFNYQVRAPATAGTYLFQWGMLWETHIRFGQSSTTSIVVTGTSSTPKPTISVSRPSQVAGQSFTTTWSTTNATSLTHVCTASGTGYTVNESLAVSGSRALTAQAAWVSYPSSCTWTATGTGGSATYTETMTTAPAATTTGSVTYIHTDGLGSPVARTDASGAVISRTRYEPYGYVASGVQPTIGFTGHVNDTDTGLTYMQQRYYDPVAGRFLSIDPVSTNVDTGLSFNRYIYGESNPYKNVDPDGRNVLLAGEAALGGTLVCGPICGAVAVGAVVVGGTYATAKLGDWIHSKWAPKRSDSSEAAGNNEKGQTSSSSPSENTNPYNGPVTEPVIVVDQHGNAIPVEQGEQVKTSPNGDYQQVRGPNGEPTGVRLDRGGHRNQPDPSAQKPHGHRPGVTRPDGNPHLPIETKDQN